MLALMIRMIRMIDSTEEGRLRGPRIEWRARAKRSPPQNPTNVLSRKILEISTLENLTTSHQGGYPKAKSLSSKLKSGPLVPQLFVYKIKIAYLP